MHLSTKPERKRSTGSRVISVKRQSFCVSGVMLKNLRTFHMALYSFLPMQNLQTLSFFAAHSSSIPEHQNDNVVSAFKAVSRVLSIFTREFTKI